MGHRYETCGARWKVVAADHDFVSVILIVLGKSIMVRMVHRVIVNECTESDIGRFCIKCGEIRDATNIEDMSVVLRYVKEAVPVEGRCSCRTSSLCSKYKGS